MILKCRAKNDESADEQWYTYVAAPTGVQAHHQAVSTNSDRTRQVYLP